MQDLMQEAMMTPAERRELGSVPRQNRATTQNESKSINMVDKKVAICMGGFVQKLSPKQRQRF